MKLSIPPVRQVAQYNPIFIGQLIINKVTVFLSWQTQCVDKKYTSKTKYIHMHKHTECVHINKRAGCCASFSIRLISPWSLSRAQLSISEIYAGRFDYRDINLMQTRGLGRQDGDIHHMVGSVISQLGSGFLVLADSLPLLFSVSFITFFDFPSQKNLWLIISIIAHISLCEIVKLFIVKKYWKM